MFISLNVVCFIILSTSCYVKSSQFSIPDLRRSTLDFFNVRKPNENHVEGVNDVTCGLYQISPGVSYKIQTPLANYGFYIPTGYQCEWEFHGTGECNPTISCDPSTFLLTESTNCTGANLEITDGYSVSEKFCGKHAPTNITTGSLIMQAIFKSNLSPPSRGFICIVSCTDKTTETSYQVVKNQLALPNTVNCKCGVPGTTSTEIPARRIVGGKAAKPLYWKWQVSLNPKTRRNPFCGGSLINDRFILTAAHCVFTTGLVSFPAAADVVLNEYDLKNSTETITIRRSIVAIHPHPLYNTITQDYDFALIEFEPVSLTSTVEPKVTPVCLPARSTKDSYLGSIGTATGWGTLKEGGAQADVLQEAEIPIISNEECNSLYEGKITPRMLCSAYPEGKIDACQGDSGGPFVVNRTNEVYTEVGVVSFGEGCARPGKPGVYSRVTEVNDWIRMKTRLAVWCQD